MLYNYVPCPYEDGHNRGSVPIFRHPENIWKNMGHPKGNQGGYGEGALMIYTGIEHHVTITLRIVYYKTLQERDTCLYIMCIIFI